MWIGLTIYFTVYDRVFGDVPAKNTVYTPYIYIYTFLAHPTYKGFWLKMNTVCTTYKGIWLNSLV